MIDQGVKYDGWHEDCLLNAVTKIKMCLYSILIQLSEENECWHLFEAKVMLWQWNGRIKFRPMPNGHRKHE